MNSLIGIVALSSEDAFTASLHDIGEVDADKCFIPHYPSVVPRRNKPHVARAELCFGTVVHSHLDPPREDVDQVANLATVGPNNRFDALRPPPSRLICDADGLGVT